MSLVEYIQSLSDTQLIFGPSFIAMGLITLFITLRRGKLSKASENWPCTDGYIMHSHLSHSYKHRSSDTSRPQTDIRYYYIVNGRKHEGTKVAFIEAYPWDYVNKFKEGDKVNVYYNPHNHKMSVLINGCHGGSCEVFALLFIAPIPFFAIGVGVFIF